MVHTYNLSTWDIESIRSGRQAYTFLYNKFVLSPGLWENLSQRKKNPSKQDLKAVLNLSNVICCSPEVYNELQFLLQHSEDTV